MIVSDEERQAPIKIEDTEPTHLARYKFALNYLSGNEVVLDSPCGSGYGTAVLASKSSRAYGVDINNGAIKHAREFFKLDNNCFHVSNIENMHDLFPDLFFNLVVSFEGIEHLQKPEYFMEEAKRLLKSSGKIIVSTPRKPHGSPYHIREYSLEEFSDLMSTYFRINNIFGQIYTDIFDLSEKTVNPHDYKKFNFIACCSKK